MHFPIEKNVDGLLLREVTCPTGYVQSVTG